ncbi:MAG: polyprenyl synthetase family protein, partial [archaeon]|nr:polyprenyl synthetase family protein [archaeon]
MALQKFEKSFAVYVKAGYEFATAKKFPSNHEKLLREISNGLDDSVMMLDDIIDASKTRNGKACIYVQEGIPFTIIKAEKLRFESIRKMTKISNLLKTKDSFKIELFQAIHGYLFDLYRGEILISSSNKSSSFENYFLAVRLFT